MSIRTYFENIADAIKDKNPNIANVTPVEMPSAIRSIPSGSSTAGGVTYDNTASGLTANNVQDAIDELAEDVSTINSDLSELEDATLLASTASTFSVDLDEYRAISLLMINSAISTVFAESRYSTSVIKSLGSGYSYIVAFNDYHAGYTSGTNHQSSITNNGNGTFTLANSNSPGCYVYGLK